MSQKNYKILIIGVLLSSPEHIRGLAKKLDTNQTTISRKIYELYDENVVDFQVEGKNKRFFLKKTVEAGLYAYIYEKYKLMNLLKQYPKLRRIIQKIQSNQSLKMAILFGSYAKGNAHKDSDIDVYIDNKELKDEIHLIDSRLSVKTGEYDKNNLLIKEIEKNHVIIKGVEAFYDKYEYFT